MNDLRWTEAQIAQLSRVRDAKPLPINMIRPAGEEPSDRRKDHDTRRLLNHALLVKRHAGVELAAVYCRFMGVDIDAAVSALARRSTLSYSYR